MTSELIRITTENDEIYEFEVVSSYSGNDTSTITTYPTSEGTPRVDNIYNNPNTFNTSIVIGGNTNISDIWGAGVDRPKNAMAILEKLKVDAISCTIVTRQKDYFNMFLTKISVDNNKSNSYDLMATLQFDELRIATFETIITQEFNNPEIQANDGTIDISSQYSEDEKTFWDSLFSDPLANTLDLAGDIVSDETFLPSVLGGAAVGAAIGSIVPGIGTAIGAGVGAAIGAVASGISTLCDWLGW